MYVCNCKAVKEAEVRARAKRSCFTFAYYIQLTSGSCCKCLPVIKRIVDENYSEAKDTRARDDSASAS